MGTGTTDYLRHPTYVFKALRVASRLPTRQKLQKSKSDRTSADSLRSPPIDDKKDCCCSCCFSLGDPPRFLPPSLDDPIGEEPSRSSWRWPRCRWRAALFKVGVEAIDGDPPRLLLGDVTCSKMLPPGSLVSSAPECTLTAAAPTRALASERPRIESWRRRSELWISAIHGHKQQHLVVLCVPFCPING